MVVYMIFLRLDPKNGGLYNGRYNIEGGMERSGGKQVRLEGKTRVALMRTRVALMRTE